VPKAVAAIVHKLMAKQPKDRYQTPAALAEALERVGANLATGIAAETETGVTLGAPPVEAGWSAIVQTPTSDLLGGSSLLLRLRRRPRRRAWLAAGLVLLVLAA